jgi:hypothetical protein
MTTSTYCSRVLLQKLTGPQLFKKCPVFYGTLKLNNNPPPVIILSQINPVHSPFILLENPV